MTVSAIRRRELPASPWAALALIVVAQFMVILDVAIVNVALPSIETDLGFTQSGLEWVVTAYAIVFGGFLLLGGRLGDVLGRRRVFAAGIALFGLSSVLCGLSWSAGSLVAFRGLQGLGGALLAPAGLSLLMTTFAEGRDRNIALGIWGAASGSGAAVGVLVGGVLTSYLSWPWIFFVNAPVAAVLLLAVPRVLRESVGTNGLRHFDLAGAASATGSVMLLVYALTLTTRLGWADPLTLAVLAAAVALGIGFVLNERRAAAPLLPLRMFRIRTFAVGNAVTTIVASIAFSEFFLLTLYLQDVLHYSAVETGLAFSAIALTIAVVSNIAQSLVTRFGPRGVLTVGLLLVTVSLVLIARLPVPGVYTVDLLGPVRAQRHRLRPLLHPRHDRGPGRRSAGPGRCGLRSPQHQPPGRWCRRPRRREHHCGRFRRGGWRRPRPRVPGLTAGARVSRPARRGAVVDAPRAVTGGRGRPAGGRAGQGGCVTRPARHPAPVARDPPRAMWLRWRRSWAGPAPQATTPRPHPSP